MADPGASAAGSADRPSLAGNADPQIAYRYGYTWQLASDGIAPLMRAQADLCARQGPGLCHVTGMDYAGDADAGDAHGIPTLAVAAEAARRVGDALERAAGAAAAERVSATVVGEDVSKRIVDTPASAPAPGCATGWPAFCKPGKAASPNWSRRSAGSRR